MGINLQLVLANIYNEKSPRRLAESCQLLGFLNFLLLRLGGHLGDDLLIVDLLSG